MAGGRCISGCADSGRRTRTALPAALHPLMPGQPTTAAGPKPSRAWLGNANAQQHPPKCTMRLLCRNTRPRATSSATCGWRGREGSRLGGGEKGGTRPVDCRAAFMNDPAAAFSSFSCGMRGRAACAPRCAPWPPSALAAPPAPPAPPAPLALRPRRYQLTRPAAMLFMRLPPCSRSSCCGRCRHQPKHGSQPWIGPGGAGKGRVGTCQMQYAHQRNRTTKVERVKAKFWLASMYSVTSIVESGPRLAPTNWRRQVCGGVWGEAAQAGRASRRQAAPQPAAGSLQPGHLVK